MGEDLTQILQASAQKQFYEDCTLAEELLLRDPKGGVTKRARGSSPHPHLSIPKVSNGPKELSVWCADPSYSFFSTTGWLHPVRPTRPSHITRYFGYQSFLSWSPYRRDLWGPARPQHVQVTADSREGGRERGEKFISTRSPKPVVQRPRDVLTSTHLRTTSTYRCVVSFVTFFSSLSLSLLRAICNNSIYHETRFETSPLTLERRSGSLKMSFLKFISVRSMQPVVSRPRQRLNHGLHRYFHVTFVWYSQSNL